MLRGFFLAILIAVLALPAGADTLPHYVQGFDVLYGVTSVTFAVANIGVLHHQSGDNPSRAGGVVGFTMGLGQFTLGVVSLGTENGAITAAGIGNAVVGVVSMYLNIENVQRASRKQQLQSSLAPKWKPLLGSVAGTPVVGLAVAY